MVGSSDGSCLSKLQYSCRLRSSAEFLSLESNFKLPLWIETLRQAPLVSCLISAGAGQGPEVGKMQLQTRRKRLQTVSSGYTD